MGNDILLARLDLSPALEANAVRTLHEMDSLTFHPRVMTGV